jgi:hypothetical protein
MTFADKLAAVKLGQAARPDYCEAEVMELVRAAEERDKALQKLMTLWQELADDSMKRPGRRTVYGRCAAELRRILEG